MFCVLIKLYFNILFTFYVHRFNKEEDQIIMKLDRCKVIKNKFAVLSLTLNRSRKQLYRRLQSLKMKSSCGSSKLRLIS